MASSSYVSPNNQLGSTHQSSVWQDDLVNELERLLDSAAADSNHRDTSVATMNSWDEDVLLSQSQLPEDDCEPLMELGTDNALSAILGDWNNFQDGDQMAGAHHWDEKCSDWLSYDMDSCNATTREIDTMVRDSLQPQANACEDAMLKGSSSRPQSYLGKLSRNVVGIVISSGPDNHFETFEVIEAPSTDLSLPAVPSTEATPAIMHAVHSHFSESNGKAMPPGSVPKIVSSDWVKYALPMEVIERIKASSQRSKTISIIEPVDLASHQSNILNNYNSTTDPSSFPQSSMVSGTRFQEAAVLLNRSKRRHQLQSTKSSLQAQVSLDHDYCTNRNKRNSRSGTSVLLSRPRTTSILNNSKTTPSNTNGVIRTKHEVSHVGEPLNFPVAVEPSSDLASESVSLSRKDSGLESGEENSSSSTDNTLYSKLPSYLTNFNTPSSEGSVVIKKEEEEEGPVYNRLPSYFLPVESCPKVEDEDSKSARASLSPPRTSSKKRVRVHSRRRHVNRHLSTDRSGSDTGSDSDSKDRSRRGRDKRRRLRSPVNRRYVGRAEERSSITKDTLPLQQEKGRQVEERRVIYVGRVPEGTTRAQLRERFDKFGPVEEISLHFRDHGDNYGFVTFRNREDAYEAIDKGNDDTRWPRVDLCFGGRRSFCKESYADLDSASKGVGSNNGNSKKQRPRKTTGDFDALLHHVKSRMRSGGDKSGSLS